MRQRIEAITLDRAEGLGDALADVLAAVKGDDAAAPGNKIDQALEGSLYRRQDRRRCRRDRTRRASGWRVGKVVQELRPLVEEGGVVLVAFEDERSGGSNHEAGAEVLRHAADEKRWRERRICCARRPRRSRPACWSSWSCRAFRRRPATRARAETRRAESTPSSRTECGYRARTPARRCRARWRCRRRRGRAADRDCSRRTARGWGSSARQAGRSSADRLRYRSR